MGIGLKLCGCCANPVGLFVASADYDYIGGTTRSEYGDESIENGIGVGGNGFGFGSDDGDSVTEYTHPLRYGVEPSPEISALPFQVFDFPPAEISHYRVAGPVTVTVEASAWQLAGKQDTPASDWATTYGTPLYLGHGVPKAKVRATQLMKLPTGGAWEPLAALQEDPAGPYLLYHRGITGQETSRPTAGGTPITAVADVAVADLYDSTIGCDIWFEFVPFAQQIKDGNDVNPAPSSSWDYYRWIVPGYDVLTHGTSPNNLHPGYGNVSITGIEYCPTLAGHTWRITAVDTPSHPFTNWCNGIQSAHTFGPLDGLDNGVVSERRTALHPGTNLPVTAERWAVWWARPWPEIQHVIGQQSGASIIYDSLWYRPTAWDGVGTATFYPHSRSYVIDPDAQSFAWSSTDRVPIAVRNPISGVGLIHPTTYELRRI